MPLERAKKTKKDWKWMGHVSFWSVLMMLTAREHTHQKKKQKKLS
jgi:hypothetical protein